MLQAIPKTIQVPEMDVGPNVLNFPDIKTIHCTSFDVLGAVILVGMIGKAVFYEEYQTMNTIGISVEGAIEVCH